MFSLETTTPLAEFDVIGFSVTYEMHAPGVLNILDLAGLPFFSAQRGDDHPLVIAGGPAVLVPRAQGWSRRVPVGERVASGPGPTVPPASSGLRESKE